MNQRFRITRSMQSNAGDQEISLEECQRYFSSKADFIYQTELTVRGEESTMSVEGDFFMWKHEEALIPFRHYMGELYVAVSHQDLVPLMIEIATDLRADIVEG